jgi:hypothetical protein
VLFQDKERLMASANEARVTPSHPREGEGMKNYVAQYHAAYGEVTLHTWTESEGRKTANYSITGTPGTAVPGWFRAVLRQKALADIALFPYCPSDAAR